jgi:hypothetical protein
MENMERLNNTCLKSWKSIVHIKGQ